MKSRAYLKVACWPDLLTRDGAIIAVLGKKCEAQRTEKRNNAARYDGINRLTVLSSQRRIRVDCLKNFMSASYGNRKGNIYSNILGLGNNDKRAIFCSGLISSSRRLYVSSFDNRH